ncbi:hypothetical protein [Vibrio kanaloae]|uniref:hypothetical protein n=1 Tax=Vibrio kanaloae TaxID=170673 RepID=UPI001245187E|nr:hypothetical protein [Vibrio kanaloae]KAB0462028.1 hypothetical protein F7Q89_15925 [Vibrio kanaloae]
MNTVVKIISHKVYLEHLELKLAKIREIAQTSEEEALALCCCYIEAIGSRRFQLSGDGAESKTRYSKAEAFTDTLVKFSGYEFWDKIHPVGLLGCLPSKSFSRNYDAYVVKLTEIGESVREPEFVREQVKELHLNFNQRKWFEDHIHKGSIGSIAYSKVRSEIVHNISHEPFTFTAMYNDVKLPDLDYELMESCLSNVLDNLKQLSEENNKFWWEF